MSTSGALLATVPGLNGGEAWIVATNLRRASANRKTGDVAQIWSIPCEGIMGSQRDVCGVCPLLPVKEGGDTGGCYVTKLFVAGIANNLRLGRYPAWDGEVRDFAPLFVRFGAWGDPCLLPLPLVERIVAAARGHMGYTHEWRRPDIQPYQRYFLASVHSPGEATEAARLGWRYFLTPLGPQDGDLPHKTIQCPHQTRGVQCRECALCDGTGGNRPLVSIWNQPHGAKNVVKAFNR